MGRHSVCWSEDQVLCEWMVLEEFWESVERDGVSSNLPFSMLGMLDWVIGDLMGHLAGDGLNYNDLV